MRDWIIEPGIASESQLEGWEAADKEAVEAARDLAWEAYQTPIRHERDRAVSILRRGDTTPGGADASPPTPTRQGTPAAIPSGAPFPIRTPRRADAPARSPLLQLIE